MIHVKQDYGKQRHRPIMQITPIQKVNVVEEIFEQLESMLIEGTWKPGDKIPSENELSETFGVSRMTVRQALQKMKALGLIETRSGSGSYVRQVNPDDSLQDLVPLMVLGDTSQQQVFQFREIIDAESIRIATPIATTEDLSRLEELLGKMKQSADNGDGEKFSEYDLKFHMGIVEITGNPLIIRTNQILQAVLAESMNSVIEKMRFAPGLDYHEKILNAMKDKDAHLAEKLMREHIRQNYHYFE